MKPSSAIITVAAINTLLAFSAPAHARCGNGFKQLGTSNRCVPIDQNDFGKMKQYCTRETQHYGKIALNNGRIDSLKEYYADCMGYKF